MLGMQYFVKQIKHCKCFVKKSILGIKHPPLPYFCPVELGKRLQLRLKKFP